MRLLRNLLLVTAALLLLAAVVIAFLPARVAVAVAGDRLAPLALHGVGGSVWRGHARELRLHGAPIGALQWTLHPRALLSRRVNADVIVDGPQWGGSGFVSYSRAHTELHGVRLRMPAESLQPAIDVPALNPRGRIEIELDHAELVGMLPRRLDGRARWPDAAVDGAAVAVLGELRAEFRTSADGNLIGTLSDTGGPLMLDGQFRLGFTGYEIEVVLEARDGHPQVLDALQYIGERQPDGSALLQVHGQFLPL